MEIFTSMPQVQHSGYKGINLLSKASVVQQHLSKYEVYYPYTIRDGERPDTIAYDYYGSPTFAWLILACNKIADPYYGWPLTYPQFHSYLRSKYGQVYELKSVISHYTYTGIDGNTTEEIDRTSYQMSATTFDNLADVDQNGWTPVYVYDYEEQLNENKRSIRLLSNQYLKQVVREINTLFNGN